MTAMGMAHERCVKRKIVVVLTGRHPQPTKGEMMLKNHKGEWCWINPNIFCQEGYCSGCEIYQKRGTGMAKQTKDKLCAKIDNCFKIDILRDKDMLDFQFVESVRAVCAKCPDYEPSNAEVKLVKLAQKRNKKQRELEAILSNKRR